MESISREQYQLLLDQLQELRAKIDTQAVSPTLPPSGEVSHYNLSLRESELREQNILLMQEMSRLQAIIKDNERAIKEREEKYEVAARALQTVKKAMSRKKSAKPPAPEIPQPEVQHREEIIPAPESVPEEWNIRTVLVVDDSRTGLAALCQMLARHSFTILKAQSGMEAVAIAMEKKPDIMLLDVVMPDMSGFEVCRVLRSRPETKQIPVIFLSALEDTASIEESFSFDNVDYVAKPPRETELISRIRTQERLRKHEREREIFVEKITSVSRESEEKKHQLTLLTKNLLQSQQELVQMNESLVEARNQAESANKAKSAFLASMSHELRTPMNAILGFTQLLQNDFALPERQRSYIQTMYHSGNHLLQVINDILDLSKIEAGKMLLTPATFDLPALLRSVQGMFALRSREKELDFELTIEPNVPRFIFSDEPKLRQILINLTGNALKFTDKGSIKIHVAEWEQSVAHPTANGEDFFFRFSVQDTGRGIPLEQIETIFEPFRQVDGIQSEGTGLGLAISRKIVEMMGGTIGVSSTEGKGSTFYFDIPLTVSNEEHLQAFQLHTTRYVGIADGKTLTALIVDDSITNRAILREILSSVGCTCIEAVNGADGVKKFHETHPDIVLLDIMMPVMDGKEAMRLLRESDDGRDTPIVAVTASTLMSEKEELIASGFDDYLSKPFHLSELFSTISRLTEIHFLSESEKGDSAEETDVTFTEVGEFLKQLAPEISQAIFDCIEIQDYNILGELLMELPLDNPDDERVIVRLARAVDEEDALFFAIITEMKYH